LDSKAASTGNVQHFDTLLYNKANWTMRGSRTVHDQQM
jgi:hypothetical protein